MRKEISSPAVVRSDKGEGFMRCFHDECRKVKDSQLRVPIVQSPYLTSAAFFSNYDLINWSSLKTKKKIL